MSLSQHCPAHRVSFPTAPVTERHTPGAVAAAVASEQRRLPDRLRRCFGGASAGGGGRSKRGATSRPLAPPRRAAAPRAPGSRSPACTRPGGTAARSARPGPAASPAASRRTRRFVEPRRNSAWPPIDVAPASSASATIRSTCPGPSLIPGISGAIRIPVGMPIRLSSATASSRARGCGVCGSVARHAFSSSVGTDRHALTRRPLGDLQQQVLVAQQQRRLREDRARVREVPHRLPDPAHQLVAPLDPLVRVGVRPERDVLARPRRPRQLDPQHLGHVDLDHDLLLEVAAGVEVEVLVRGAREAVKARMTASSIRVDRPPERHP